jgi:hypothetical protein
MPGPSKYIEKWRIYTHNNDTKSFAHLKKHLEDLSAAMIGLQVDSGACGPTQLFVGMCRDMYIYITYFNRSFATFATFFYVNGWPPINQPWSA